jgi:hypothetical protein
MTKFCIYSRLYIIRGYQMSFLSGTPNLPNKRGNTSSFKTHQTSIPNRVKTRETLRGPGVPTAIHDRMQYTHSKVSKNL